MDIVINEDKEFVLLGDLNKNVVNEEIEEIGAILQRL